MVRMLDRETSSSMTKKSDLPYLDSGHERHVLDLYLPEETDGAARPVIFWIHGGGWIEGDKSDVGLKPTTFTGKGCVFVSINHRLLPEVTMGELIRDVSRALGWVYRHIKEIGGDPTRIVVGGHSSGAQLAALVCSDHQFVEEAEVPPHVIRGCIAVDGDTYDIPKIILTAETRQDLYGGQPFTLGHRQKFEDDPDKHIEYSAVTHIAKGKEIPPFLILYFSGNPDTTAQARRFEAVLEGADIPVTVHGKLDTNHERLNSELGIQGDSASEELFRFLEETLPT